MEPITIPFTPTPAEAAEARRALFTAPGTPPPNPMLPRRIEDPRSDRMPRTVIAWLGLVTVGLAVYVALGQLPRLLPRSSRAGRTNHVAQPIVTRDLLIGGGAVVLGFCLLATGIVWSNRISRNPRRAKDVSFTFTDDGVTELRPGRRYWSGWGEFHSFAETEKLLVLRVTPQSAMYFPKRLFSGEAQVAALRELLVRNLVAPAPPS